MVHEIDGAHAAKPTKSWKYFTIYLCICSVMIWNVDCSSKIIPTDTKESEEYRRREACAQGHLKFVENAQRDIFEVQEIPISPGNYREQQYKDVKIKELEEKLILAKKRALSLISFHGAPMAFESLLDKCKDDDFLPVIMEKLLVSACRNHIGIVKILLSRGVNVNAVCTEGGTALIDSIQFKKVDIFKLLLENSADVDLQDVNGNSPISCAIKHRRFEFFKILIERGVDLNVEDENDCSILNPFDLSAELMMSMLNGGLLADTRIIDGRPILTWAVAQQEYELVESLIEKGANVNAMNSHNPTRWYNSTALGCAMRLGDMYLIKLLLKNNARFSLAHKGDNTFKFFPSPPHQCVRFLALFTAITPDENNDCGHDFGNIIALFKEFYKQFELEITQKLQENDRNKDHSNDHVVLSAAEKVELIELFLKVYEQIEQDCALMYTLEVGGLLRDKVFEDGVSSIIQSYCGEPPVTVGDLQLQHPQRILDIFRNSVLPFEILDEITHTLGSLSRSDAELIRFNCLLEQKESSTYQSLMTFVGGIEEERRAARKVKKLIYRSLSSFLQVSAPQRGSSNECKIEEVSSEVDIQKSDDDSDSGPGGVDLKTEMD